MGAAPCDRPAGFGATSAGLRPADSLRASRTRLTR